MKICVAGETLDLKADRALYWPRLRSLFLADLHVGKVETFQRFGVPLPTAQARADMDRLNRLISATGAAAVYVLGDLVHGAVAGDTDWLRKLTAGHPTVSFSLVAGNHDRQLRALPASWRFEVLMAPQPLGPFLLQHEPIAHKDGYVLAGHTHPVVWARGSSDALRLPCFHFTEAVGTLPAFTEFSGGCAVDPKVGRAYAIVDDAVVGL